MVAFLAERAAARRRRASRPERIVLDAGLDLGKTATMSLELLRAATARRLGYPLLLSASNKRFLGELLGLEIDGDRRLAAAPARHRDRTAAASCAPRRRGAGGWPT